MRSVGGLCGKRERFPYRESATVFFSSQITVASEVKEREGERMGARTSKAIAESSRRPSWAAG